MYRNPTKREYLEVLLRSQKTVFTTKDIALLWGEEAENATSVRLSKYVKAGKLIRLYRGIYAKDKSYDPKELATSVYSPSYISFETVLRESGIVFQHYDTIFVAGPWSVVKKIDARTVTFRRMKDSVLFNPAGVRIGDHYSIATSERAFLDMLSLFPKYHFDNLRSIDWDTCAELAKIYDNKQLMKRFMSYRKNYAE